MVLNEDKFSLSLLKCIWRARFKFKILGQGAGLLHIFHLPRASNEKREISPCSSCSNSNSKTLGVEEGGGVLEVPHTVVTPSKEKNIPKMVVLPTGSMPSPWLLQLS